MLEVAKDYGVKNRDDVLKAIALSSKKHGGSSRCKKKWSDSGYILKVKPTLLPDRLDVCEIKRVVKNYSRFFHWSNPKDGITIN